MGMHIQGSKTGFGVQIKNRMNNCQKTHLMILYKHNV